MATNFLNVVALRNVFRVLFQCSTWKGWELALVTALSSNLSYVNDKQLIVEMAKGTCPDGSIVKADVEDYLVYIFLASLGKKASATAPKAKDAAGAPLDYSDIPHTQIRKGMQLDKWELMMWMRSSARISELTKGSARNLYFV